MITVGNSEIFITDAAQVSGNLCTLANGLVVMVVGVVVVCSILFQRSLVVCDDRNRSESIYSTNDRCETCWHILFLIGIAHFLLRVRDSERIFINHATVLRPPVKPPVGRTLGIVNETFISVLCSAFDDCNEYVL